MILSDTSILEEIEKGTIVISPMTGNTLALILTTCTSVNTWQRIRTGYWMRRSHNEIEHFEIPEEGFVLQPGTLYLGVTLEYTETHAHVPFLEGKSSTGRLGIDIHATAGKGDVGFCNTWTLEISCAQPVRVYAGMPCIGQLIYYLVVEGGSWLLSITKGNANYNNRTVKPESKYDVAE